MADNRPAMPARCRRWRWVGRAFDVDRALGGQRRHCSDRGHGERDTRGRPRQRSRGRPSGLASAASKMIRRRCLHDEFHDGLDQMTALHVDPVAWRRRLCLFIHLLQFVPTMRPGEVARRRSPRGPEHRRRSSGRSAYRPDDPPIQRKSPSCSSHPPTLGNHRPPGRSEGARAEGPFLTGVALPSPPDVALPATPAPGARLTRPSPSDSRRRPRQAMTWTDAVDASKARRV
jgi:hypothetical protein